MRISFCRSVSVALVGALFASAVLSSAKVHAAAVRPNFLFIYTDDQQWAAMSVVQREQGAAGRFPWLKTPNMDRIAAEGVRFRNAFVVNSLCSPSRASFLTGRYNHYNGIANNHTSLPDGSITYATQLTAAGYHTGYIGKFHMGNQSGKRPGFVYSASFVGQGRYQDCPFEVNGVTTQTKGWVDDVSTDYAIEFLKENKAKPFMLVLGFKSSHGPWDPPERLKDRFVNDEPKPALNASARAIYREGDTNAAPSANTKAPAASAGKTDMIRNYMRTLTGVDENVGRVLKALDDLKLAENTVLIYTTDNGYYLGEHGQGDKRTAYEESLRIPLLVRYPKGVAKDRTIDQIALNIDLAPTLLDYAGVAIPETMQGRSWRPLLEQKNVVWRKAFFYEYFYERGYNLPTVFALRTETSKLIQYPGHPEWTELFDIQSDPYEMKNLAKDPAQKAFLDQMREMYEKEAKAVGFHIPDYADKPGDEDRPAGKGKKGKGGKGGGGEGAARTSQNEVVLAYNFANGVVEPVPDVSGKNNSGIAHGATTTAGRNGSKALKFDGQSYIEVPKSASLNPSHGSWTVEAVVKAEKPDGVVLARGGQSLGYALYLEDGKPVFCLNLGTKVVKAAGAAIPTGEWTHLAGVIGRDLSLKLYVNGTQAATAKLKGFIERDPNDTMQIGNDNATTVTSYKSKGFVGAISQVQIYSGERTAEEIKLAAQKP